MTSRQAKRLGKKNVGQFQYTASQMRRADRREELEKRRQKDQEKERKKKENKRKREEQEEKQRASKRRLLREGKINEEDTWGRVTASQPRLNTFFKAPETVKRSMSAPEQATHNGISDSCDSQEETLVDDTVLPRHEPLSDSEKDLEYISDRDLLQLASSQPHPSNPTPPVSFEERDHQKVKTGSQTASRKRHSFTTNKMSKRARSLSPDEGAHDRQQGEDLEESLADFDVAEDETAETDHAPVLHENNPLMPHISHNSTSRSALSEMSVANVNTRAQEKPDSTSAPGDECGLPSPPKPAANLRSSAEDLLAMISPTDFSDDDDELTWDKENTDPLDTPSKDKGKKPASSNPETKHSPSSSKKPATPGFSKFVDCEDIFDFDFDTASNDDEFDEGGVDDATLMAMAATQKPKPDLIVDAHGSPKKVSPFRNAIVKPAPLEYTPGRSMPAPPSTSALLLRRPPPPRTTVSSKAYQPSRLSESFSSVNDEDLLVLAEKVEEELSQKRVLQQKEIREVDGGLKKKTGRILPWVRNPLPPLSTQDVLWELAEEVEAEMEAEVEVEDE